MPFAAKVERAHFTTDSESYAQSKCVPLAASPLSRLPSSDHHRRLPEEGELLIMLPDPAETGDGEDLPMRD